MNSHAASAPRLASPHLLAAGLAALLLGACATTPLPRDYESRLPERAEPPPPPAIYPARGQSPAQLRRDRYECYQWAITQSGFDPAAVRARPTPLPPRVYADPPSGSGTAAGVVTGALLGAAVSSSHHSAEGAAVGALLGGIVGAASDNARELEARRVEGELAADYRERRSSAYDGRAGAHQRAFAACLEGRGYSVK